MTTDEIIDTKTAALLAELEELVTKRVTAEAYADALNDIAIRYGTPILMAALLLLTVAVRHADSQIATHGRREAEQRAAIDVLKQEVRELKQQRDATRTELRDVVTTKQQLTDDLTAVRAQLAGFRVLFEEQGKTLAKARQEVAGIRNAITTSRQFFAEQAASDDPMRRELAMMVVHALDRITEVGNG